MLRWQNLAFPPGEERGVEGIKYPILMIKVIFALSGIRYAPCPVDGGVKVKRWRRTMISLSCLTLVVVVSLVLTLALEVALSLWRNGKAVEIDLRDLEGLSFEVPSEEVE
ncbi:MAG: hypothetical protein ACM3MN_10530 [Nitrospirota bacterium]